MLICANCNFVHRKIIQFFLLLFFCFLFVACDRFEEFKKIFYPDRNELPNLYAREKGCLVIAGSPFAAEILEDLSYKSVIGICSDYDFKFEYYKGVSNIGNSKYPNLQIIKKLQPEFFISDSSVKKQIDSIFIGNSKNYDFSGSINIKYLNFETYFNSLDSILELGRIVKREKDADKIIQTIEAKLLELRRANFGIDSPKVLVLYELNDTFVVGTKKSYIGSLLDALKIDNIADTIQHNNSSYISFNLLSANNLKNIDVILVVKKNTPEPNLIDFSKILQVAKGCKIIQLAYDQAFFARGLKMMHYAEKINEMVYE